MAWVAVLGTLLGAAIGACGAIASQYIAGRASERRDVKQRLSALRSERLAAIHAFLDAAQEVERVASDVEKFDHASKSKVGHTLWTTHKQLSLICSDELAGPLDKLADRLAKALWHGPPDGVPVWKYIHGDVGRFRLAAKRDLHWAEETSATH